MKRLLLSIALLSIPALSSAQEGPESETWTTYCDNGVERVRSDFIVRLYDPIWPEDMFGPWAGEVYAGTSCEDACMNYPDYGTITPLGSNRYRYSFTWPRECLGSEVIRSGRLFYGVMIDDYPEGRYAILECTDGPQPIVDNVDCSPLPVASSTWGAIKALYRVQGETP